MSPPVAPGSIENMLYPEKARYRAAAFRATRLFPGAIGEVLSSEILVLEEFGWIPGAQGRGSRLVAAVEAMQLPTPSPRSAA